MKKLIRKASGGMKSPDDIIYLDYPEYEGSGTSGYPGAEIALKIGVPDKLPVGHNSFILVDDNGGTLYYEYGRYNKTTLPAGGQFIGDYKEGKGNWVRIGIEDVPKKEDGSLDYDTYFKTTTLPHSNQGTANATVIKHTNNDAVRKYINLASGSTRLPYNLANTCATQAAIATHVGMIAHPYNLIRFRNPIKGISTSISNAVKSKGWELIPGSSQRYGAYMSGYGTTYKANNR